MPVGDPRLTLLYTANLAGRLDRLPRLFSLVRDVREAAGAPTALLDLGGSCDPAVAECAATEGRAALFVLEAMGYDAACLSAADCAALSERAARKLMQEIGIPLCAPCAGLPLPGYCLWQAGPWRVACLAGADGPPQADLVIRPLPPGREPYLEREARTLWLAAPAGDVLGVVEITLEAAGLPVAATWRWQRLAAGARPDPTIAAAVEFVRDEARRHQQIHNRGGAHATG